MMEGVSQGRRSQVQTSPILSLLVQTLPTPLVLTSNLTNIVRSRIFFQVWYGFPLAATIPCCKKRKKDCAIPLL